MFRDYCDNLLEDGTLCYDGAPDGRCCEECYDDWFQYAKWEARGKPNPHVEANVHVDMKYNVTES